VSTDPSACRWCGLSKEGHMSQWHAAAGWHTWTEPTTEQRYEAIRANAAERKSGTDLGEWTADDFEAADDADRRWE
jgi:hypothetical protein